MLIEEFNVSPASLAAWHCPGCGAAMKHRPVMDPFVHGFECANGHR